MSESIEKCSADGNTYPHHEWAKWEIYKAKIAYIFLSLDYEVSRQKRVCKRCGIMETRDIK